MHIQTDNPTWARLMASRLRRLGTHARAMAFTGAMAAGIAAGTATLAVAQTKTQATPTATTVHSLGGSAYWIEGAANTGFVVGENGVFVIEAQRNNDAARAQIAEIAKVTPLPIDTLIVTHADPDSVGGALAYPASVPIIAHENTGPQIIAGAADADHHPTFGPIYRSLLARLPDRTISQTEKVRLDGVETVLIAAAPAHTGADIAIYLPAQKVVFAGDIISTNTGPYPVIHRASGGTSQGWIAAMAALLALDARIVIPGHGPVETRALLEKRLHDARERREQVKALVGEHQTLAQIRAALHDEPTASPFLSYVEIVYSELTAGYPVARAPWSNLRRPPAFAPVTAP